MTHLKQLVRRLGGPGLVAVAAAEEPDDAALLEIATVVAPGLAGARAWADACDAVLNEPDRTALGAHATPWPLADWLAERVPAEPAATVLDPACGTGHLLVAAAARQLRAPDRWLAWDLAPARAAATRIALWLAHGREGGPADYRHVRALDTLLDEPAAAADVLLANPPFVSIRELARSWSDDYPARLRERLPKLTGSFDLYVPFLLRLREWLAPAGRFGVILPATVWSAAYAAPGRAALAGYVDGAHRMRGRTVFPAAAVTTHVLLGGAERIEELSLFETDLDELPARSVREGRVPAGALEGSGFPGAAAHLSAPTVALGDLAEVTAGTPGYHAAAVAAGLRERGEGDGEPALPFVVTRSIDPYRVELGPVRFLRRRWHQPELRLDVLSAGKRALFEATKVLVAGVSRRLEAARDARGLALGVGVYAVVPHAVPTELVLALLNSAVVSDWYRRRFLGRELSGGYFAVNVAHLREVPVPRAWLSGRADVGRLVALVRAREACEEPGESGLLEAEIDALVASGLAG